MEIQTREQLLRKLLPDAWLAQRYAKSCPEVPPRIPLILVAWENETTWSALFTNDDDVFYWRPETNIILKAPGETQNLISNIGTANLAREEVIDGVTLSFCLP